MENDEDDFASEEFRSGTKTLREWLNGDSVNAEDLVRELDYWLRYFGGAP